jgi:hypothetical protein
MKAPFSRLKLCQSTPESHTENNQVASAEAPAADMTKNNLQNKEIISVAKKVQKGSQQSAEKDDD